MEQPRGRNAGEGRERGLGLLIRDRCGGVQSEGQAPEVVGVAGFGSGGNDGDAAFGGGKAFGFVKVFAQERVDGMTDGSRFVGLEEAGGKHLGAEARVTSAEF